MTTSPNNSPYWEDPWVRAMLEHMGEDPDDERGDTNVPSTWFEEPGFLYADPIASAEEVPERLASYRASGLRAQYRSIKDGNEVRGYMLVFNDEHKPE